MIGVGEGAFATSVTLDPDSKPAKEVTPDFNAAFSSKTVIRSACEDYRELIEQGLVRGRNGKALRQDLVSEHGFTGSYQAVKRFVRKLRGPQVPEPAGIILTAPGEEAQVDYGTGPMVSHAGIVDHKPISSVFSCFAGVAKRHEPLVREIPLIWHNRQLRLLWYKKRRASSLGSTCWSHLKCISLGPLRQLAKQKFP